MSTRRRCSPRRRRRESPSWRAPTSCSRVAAPPCGSHSRPYRRTGSRRGWPASREPSHVCAARSRTRKPPSSRSVLADDFLGALVEAEVLGSPRVGLAPLLRLVLGHRLDDRSKTPLGDVPVRDQCSCLRFHLTSPVVFELPA